MTGSRVFRMTCLGISALALVGTALYLYGPPIKFHEPTSGCTVILADGGSPSIMARLKESIETVELTPLENGEPMAFPTVYITEAGGETYKVAIVEIRSQVEDGNLVAQKAYSDGRLVANAYTIVRVGAARPQQDRH
jgi:hypothetical protein